MIIGMFHIRSNPDRVTRAYLYASVAKMEGYDFFYFTPSNVDFENKVIHGKYYQNGKWLEKTYPFPDIIMNIGYPITEQQKEIYNRLRKLVPVTGYAVGNKAEVYEAIIHGKQFQKHIIPYRVLRNVDEAILFLDQHPKAIIKPLVGHHGNNVIYVEKGHGIYIVQSESQKRNLSIHELHNYLQTAMEQNVLLIQKFISCRRKTGEPYDLRLDLHKNGQGKWKAEIYAKIGNKERVITNVSRGGQATILGNFLRNEFPENHVKIQHYLESFAEQFAEHFESLYSHPFDELGVDVGLDENLNIWIYEVNWRPGRSFTETSIAKDVVMYAVYEACRHKKE